MLFRLLMLLFAAWIGWRIYVVLSRRGGGPERPLPPVEDMVQCARCGVHVARSVALHQGSHWYCSEAHRAGHDASA
jgi:uncharacterized protein